MHDLAVRSGVRGYGFVADPESTRSRLNSALNLYTETVRLSGRGQSNIKAWRAGLAQLARDTATALGDVDQEHWIAKDLRLSTEFVRRLRRDLAFLEAAAQADIHDPGRREWAKWGLFHQIAPIYEQAYGANYAVTFSAALSESAGQALRWTEKLLDLAASRPDAAHEVKDLAVWAHDNREGLAKRIKEARDGLMAGREMVQQISDVDGAEDPP